MFWAIWRRDRRCGDCKRCSGGDAGFGRGRDPDHRNRPLVVGEAGVELGIGVNIDVPAQAGADRLVNAVGAMASHECRRSCWISERDDT